MTVREEAAALSVKLGINRKVYNPRSRALTTDQIAGNLMLLVVRDPLWVRPKKLSGPTFHRGVIAVAKKILARDGDKTR